MNDERTAETPSTTIGFLFQEGKKRGRLSNYGRGGKTIADDHLNITVLRTKATNSFSRVVVESPTEVRPHQILGFLPDSRLRIEQVKTFDPEIQVRMDRVPGDGVVFPEFQPGIGSIRGAGSAGRQTGRCVGESPAERVVLGNRCQAGVTHGI